MAYRFNLTVRIESFSCCGSASVHGFYGDGTSYKIMTDKEGIDKLVSVETILQRDRRNLALAVITHIQAENWKKYLDARGWIKVGNSVVNSKTNNRLETWMLDMVNRQVTELEQPPAPPVSGFNFNGVRQDRRDEPRTAQVGPRQNRNDWGEPKEYFMDVNGHRVLTVDLPVFARGALREVDLNFYSIRLTNGGGSYSWLQGGTHRFPLGIQPPQPDAVAVLVDGDDADLDDDDDL